MIIKPNNRYGKPMGTILRTKQSFFSSNSDLLNSTEQLRKIYIAQPLRKLCKVCNADIPASPYYHSHGTPFFLCDNCGHVNGKYEDGEQYTKDLYKSGIYGGDYRVETIQQYVHRMDAIYLPKVQFLEDTLSFSDDNYKEYKYLDIGTGVGYMVGAYDRYGLNAYGVDVDERQIAYGNRMLGRELLSKANPEEIAPLIAHTDCEVVSFINVLEHVVNLQEILSALQNNENIKYVYFCVPKLSLSCVLEIILPDVYPRHIGGGGGHTHLFTDESLNWICNKYHFTQLAKWQFGTDIMDLYRFLCVMMEKSNASEDFISKVSSFFVEHTDAIQMIVDKTDLASDTHIILKK